MAIRNSILVGLVMLILGTGLGYSLSPQTTTDVKESAEYLELQSLTQQFRSHGIPCFPAHRVEEEVNSDIWAHYNYDEDGNLFMIGIKTTQPQDTSIWAHLPEGRPGMDFEFWSIHVWFKDINDVCLELDGLLEKLSEEGYEIEDTGETEQPFFPVNGETFQINGDTLQIYQFKDVFEATDEAATVSPDGNTIKNTLVTWIDTPHFYHHGKMIIIYLGDNEDILQSFQDKIAYQFAGG
jgi:hypothetical protein